MRLPRMYHAGRLPENLEEGGTFPGTLMRSIPRDGYRMRDACRPKGEQREADTESRDARLRIRPSTHLPAGRRAPSDRTHDKHICTARSYTIRTRERHQNGRNGGREDSRRTRHTHVSLRAVIPRAARAPPRDSANTPRARAGDASSRSSDRARGYSAMPRRSPREREPSRGGARAALRLRLTGARTGAVQL